MNDSITLGNVIGWAIVLIGLAGTTWFNTRTVRRQTEDDTRRLVSERVAITEARLDADIDALTERITGAITRLISVETKVNDFMPRSEIEGKFELIQRNAMQAQESAMRLFTRTADEVTIIRVDLATVRAEHDGLVSGMGELKELVKEQHAEASRQLASLRDVLLRQGGAHA